MDRRAKGGSGGGKWRKKVDEERWKVEVRRKVEEERRKVEEGRWKVRNPYHPPPPQRQGPEEAPGVRRVPPLSRRLDGHARVCQVVRGTGCVVKKQHKLNNASIQLNLKVKS